MIWKSAAGEVTRRDPMQERTDTFIQQFELGIKPWVRPWDPLKCQGPQAPFNPTTQSNGYRQGLNG